MLPSVGKTAVVEAVPESVLADAIVKLVELAVVAPLAHAYEKLTTVFGSTAVG